tara:strand:- start:52 stop:411 length:360 start_codon:yes stop_codon:yes gene_type:complete
MSKEKQVEYTNKIITALQPLFDSKNPNGISLKELKEQDNLSSFVHALANIAPTSMMNQLTGHKKTLLESNHIANTLCFQYGEIEQPQEPEIEETILNSEKVEKEVVPLNTQGDAGDDKG